MRSCVRDWVWRTEVAPDGAPGRGRRAGLPGATWPIASLLTGAAIILPGSLTPAAMSFWVKPWRHDAIKSMQREWVDSEISLTCHLLRLSRTVWHKSHPTPATVASPPQLLHSAWCYLKASWWLHVYYLPLPPHPPEPKAPENKDGVCSLHCCIPSNAWKKKTGLRKMRVSRVRGAHDRGKTQLKYNDCYFACCLKWCCIPPTPRLKSGKLKFLQELVKYDDKLHSHWKRFWYGDLVPIY